ncbi:MAG: DUF2179 domain-containing protein, partial [Myxococcales bacterium]|nr:DUF2179 domain-containing protein [Myxococcales bacterium]
IILMTAITKIPDQVGQSLTSVSRHRTYTLDEGQGGHSKERYWVLRTLVTHEELPEIIQAIEESDPSSFYFYHDIEGTSRKYYIEPIS